jgi:hypothetical protein
MSELCCSMYFFVSIVLFYVLFVCKCVLLPLGVNPIAVKYIISYLHDVLKIFVKVFMIINTLLEPEIKLTYIMYVEAFLIKMDYVCP